MSATQRQVALELSKDQLSNILKCVAPFRDEENVKISFAGSNAIFEVESMGNTGKITIGSESITPEHADVEFFIAKQILASVYQNMPNACKFIFYHDGETWASASVNIAGDDINLGLPIFDKEIRTDFTLTDSEDMLSEKLAEALKRTEVSNIQSGAPAGAIEVGKELVSGTSLSVSRYKKLLKNLHLKVSPSFRPHLNQICKFGGMVKIGVTDNNEAVFISENVEYKTGLLPHGIPDLEQILAGQNSRFRVGIQHLIDALSRLSIPLMGEDAELYITAEDKNIKLEIFDIQNRKSESVLRAVDLEGGGKAMVNINSLKQVASAFDDDAIISFRVAEGDDEAVVALVIEDDLQIAYLQANIN